MREVPIAGDADDVCVRGIVCATCNIKRANVREGAAEEPTQGNKFLEPLIDDVIPRVGVAISGQGKRQRDLRRR